MNRRKPGEQPRTLKCDLGPSLLRRRRIRADARLVPWPIAAYYHNHLNVKIFLSSIVADTNRNTNKVDARY
jgi:hypothetical protein